MSVAIPYHEVNQALLPSALGARIALNRQLGIPYQNSLLLSEQSFYVRVVNNQFKLPLPPNDASISNLEETAFTPAITVNGKFGVLNTPTTAPWVTVTGVMGYGSLGEEVVDPWDDVLDTGDLLYSETANQVIRVGKDSSTAETRYPTLSGHFYEFIPDGTLALLSELITDRIADLPDVVNDVNADINFIPRTIISGLEPMLRGFTY